jgi:Zn-dependent protease
MLQDILHIIWLRFPLALLLARLAVVPLSLWLHDQAHALVAALLGDPTPRESGRLTLNPLRHVPGLGIITGVLAGIAWSRPVPIRPHRMKAPGWLGGPLAVLAGPLATVGLALAGRALLGALGLRLAFPWAGWPSLADLLTVLARFNLGLALLNALPLYPLDAHQLIHFVLPLRAAAWWERASGWTTAALGVGLAALLMLPPWVIIPAAGPAMRWGWSLLGW